MSVLGVLAPRLKGGTHSFSILVCAVLKSSWENRPLETTGHLNLHRFFDLHVDGPTRERSVALLLGEGRRRGRRGLLSGVTSWPESVANVETSQ